jgi:diacylglycerol kinase family enzyme
MQVARSSPSQRWAKLDLLRPAALVFNPHAGRKVGMSTNTHGLDDVRAALQKEGVPFEVWQTEGPGHATVLAQRAVRRRRGGSGSQS